MFQEWNPVFQFHEGPIKTGSLNTRWKVKGCFNSMKVRLKLPLTIHITKRTFLFQFHEGPIKT